MIAGEYQMVLTVTPDKTQPAAHEIEEAVGLAALTRLALRKDGTFRITTGFGEHVLTHEGVWEAKGTRVALKTQKVVNPDGSLAAPSGPVDAPWGPPDEFELAASNQALIPVDSIGPDGIAQWYYLRLPPRDALRLQRAPQ
jgi:hypothetical protein